MIKCRSTRWHDFCKGHLTVEKTSDCRLVGGIQYGAVGMSERNEDQLNDLADKTLPDLMAAAIAGVNQAYAEDDRPTADLHLPSLDAASEACSARWTGSLRY